ncbi:MAG: hypothetical protein IPP57_08560 [Candidatus Obscuribacter sp.]|nr:hypothetical protein [Candidatus Obscuribacter sp.]
MGSASGRQARASPGQPSRPGSAGGAALVQSYLSRMGAFVRSLELLAQVLGKSDFAPWLERLRNERLHCQVKVNRCKTAGESPDSALLTACYQDYARLFNSVVDVYQLACDRCRAPATDGSLQTYSADIGLWERGVTVELQATSVEQALALAGVAVTEARHDGRISDDDEQMVVQVHLLPGQSDAKPRLVYDFINGIYQ